MRSTSSAARPLTDALPRLLTVSAGLLEARAAAGAGEPAAHASPARGARRRSRLGRRAGAGPAPAGRGRRGRRRPDPVRGVPGGREGRAPFLFGARGGQRARARSRTTRCATSRPRLDSLERAPRHGRAARLLDRSIVRYGAPLRSLLRRRLARRHAPSSARRGAAGDPRAAGPRTPSGRRQAPLGSRCRDRELTILRYLPTILSNAEIAAELSLSVNTVKTHVPQLYRKLDATRPPRGRPPRPRAAAAQPRDRRGLGRRPPARWDHPPAVSTDRSAARWRRYLDAVNFDEAPRPLRAAFEFAFVALRRFIAIEGAQQAIVLAAQAFTSLIPLMVVAAAASPGSEDLADRIVERFGLHGDSARSMQQLFATAGTTQSTITWISIVILMLSALSFTRALQRVFQRAYVRKPDMIQDQQRGLVWLVCLGIWVTLLSPLHESLEHLGGIVFAVLVATASGFLLWLGTPMLLLGERDWRCLAPGRAGVRAPGRAARRRLEHLRSDRNGLVRREVRPDRDRLRAAVVAARRRVRDRDRRGDRRDRRRARRRLQDRAWLTRATSTSRGAPGWPPSAPGWPGGALGIAAPRTAAVASRRRGAVSWSTDRAPRTWCWAAGYAVLAAVIFVGGRPAAAGRSAARSTPGAYEDVGDAGVLRASRCAATRARARHARDHHRPALGLS